ncbi:hypothetical protein [Kribbella karoonensis]|uniref:TrbL/VirB6 plasmid conjugal transfer protein n=1 Tax=Kribbella karoonensis TaxID=324851 RepID=A0ABN2DYI8_9ACTN
MIALDCSWWPWDWADCVKKYVGDVLGWFFGEIFKHIFEAVAKVVLDAVTAVIDAVAFLWVNLDTPDVSQPGAATWMQDHLNFLVIVVGGIAVIVGAMQMAFMQRGEPLRDILKSLLTLAVVSSAGAMFAATLIKAADAFSQWIIISALKLPTDPKTHAIKGPAIATMFTKALVDPLKTPQEAFGFMLVICVGILMVITSIVQLALMVVRYGMLVLLVGVLPLTAAATNTEMGMMWFKRAIGWLAGFIIYKPVAALIYATALALMGNSPEVQGAADGTSDAMKMAMGITLMIVAVVALPAILRFVAPKPS